MELKSGGIKDKHMSMADEIFINMCRDILENGTSTEGEKVRPHWPDGTSAYTIKKFGVVNRYDLSKEFPLLTLRRTALKSATDEVQKYFHIPDDLYYGCSAVHPGRVQYQRVCTAPDGRHCMRYIFLHLPGERVLVSAAHQSRRKESREE